MKKTYTVILSLLLLLSLFASCGTAAAPDPGLETTTSETTDPLSELESGSAEDSVTVRLGGLKGPTSMGMVKLLDDAEKGLTENTYTFSMAPAADELTPKLLKGELDILAVPANLGAILYQNSDGAVRTAAVGTLGVIYIVERGGETIESLADLKGMTVYATGKGSTPEFVLNYLLSQSGLDAASDVKVEWKSEPTEVVAQMATMDHAVAMLPQPFVTVASTQLSDLRIALDLTDIWDALDNGSQFITSTLIVRAEFASGHPEVLETFLKEYRDSTAFINENPAEGAVLVEKYDIVKAPIAEKAIPYCNMVCLTGEDMKESLSGYLEVLFAANPGAVGGALPADDFYILYE